MVNMKIDHFVVGPVQTNCYFVTNIKTKEMIIIDPGACANQLAKKVDESGAKPVCHGCKAARRPLRHQDIYP